MARPLWSGTIQISLIGFAVEIYPATNAARAISFHEIDRNTLSRVRRQNVAPAPPPAEISAEPTDEELPAANAPVKHQMSLHLAAKVSQEDIAPRNGSEEMTPRLVQKADIAKGYEYEKGKYAVVEPEELKNLRLAGKKTIEIAQFAKSKEIDPSLYEKPYFVVPKAGPQATAFAVIRQSMIDRQMVGIGEIVFSGRQHLIALAPPHDPNQLGMMLYTLRFATELRDPREFFKDIASVPIEAQQRNLANQLIDIWTQPFDANKFTDQYEAALRDLVEAKIKHLPAPAVQSGKKSEKVIDLMEALRRSIDQRNRSSAGVSPTTATEASTSLPKKPPAVTRAKTGSGRKRTST